MDTAARPSQTARPTDRLLEALSTVAALLDRTIHEVKAVENDIQARILKAVHDTEASVQSQAAQHLEQSLAQNADALRRDLSDRFNAEIQRLQTEIQGLQKDLEAERERLGRELAQSIDAASRLELERNQLVDELHRSRHDAQTEIQKAYETAQNLQQTVIEGGDQIRRELTEQFNAELHRRQSEFEAERERLGRALEQSAEAAVQWEAERSRLVAEVERLRQEVEAGNRKAEEAAAAPPASPHANGAGANGAITDEIARAQSRLQEIMVIIDDPATELSTVIRKNVERSEIESYLKGIQFAVDRGK